VANFKKRVADLKNALGLNDDHAKRVVIRVVYIESELDESSGTCVRRERELPAEYPPLRPWGEVQTLNGQKLQVLFPIGGDGGDASHE
jgi:hypothetical protein